MSFYRGDVTGNGTFTNGDGTVVFDGTVNMLTNAKAGEEIQGPDGLNYEIYSQTDALTIEIKPAYRGVTVTSPDWHVIPVQGFQQDLAKTVAAAMALMATWTNLGVFDLGVPQYRGTEWEVRSPTQLLLDLMTGTADVDTIAAAPTTDIGSTSAFIVDVAGAADVTSLGNVPLCIRLVHWVDNPTLHNESTALKLLTNANRAVTSNSWGLYISDALAHWTEAFYGAHA